MKPSPAQALFDQIEQVVAKNIPAGLHRDVGEQLKSAIQRSLEKLDMVSREEFDAQREVLKRTEKRVAEMEQQLEALTTLLEKLEQQ